MEASKDKPTVVMIVVSLEDSSQSETRYISGKTVAEVVAELFGEKEPKPRRKRRTKAEIAAGINPVTGCATDAPPAGEPAPGTEAPEKPRKGRKVWPDGKKD